MTQTFECSECGYIQPLDEYDAKEPCVGCRALDDYLENYGQRRWEEGQQSWYEFWQECERIKGKL